MRRVWHSICRAYLVFGILKTLNLAFLSSNRMATLLSGAPELADVAGGLVDGELAGADGVISGRVARVLEVRAVGGRAVAAGLGDWKGGRTKRMREI